MERRNQDPFATPILVIGPNGEETRILASTLFDRLDESGYQYSVGESEIAIFINGNSLELEVIY